MFGQTPMVIGRSQTMIPTQLTMENWKKDCQGNEVTTEPYYNEYRIEGDLGASTNNGFVAIEFYYCYHQALNLPIINNFHTQPDEDPCIHSHACPGCTADGHTQTLKIRDHTAAAARCWVIFAVALVAMLLFVGLAIDAGVLYITYGQLKRAVDAAAVAAANEFKRGSTLASMNEAANEELRFHNIASGTNLDLYICDSDGDGIRDIALQSAVPTFYERCPDTTAGYSPRKLVWVEARLKAPLYFLSLIGFQSVNLNTNSISEAAPVDVVIVLDTSESMASDTVNYLKAAYPDIVDDYNPDAAAPLGCNSTNSCQPLLDAKTAAKALIDTLYEGYDQVSIVTFDSVALAHPIVNKLGNPVNLSDDMVEAKAVVDSIPLHDDPAFARMWPYWRSSLVGNKQIFNPVNPEDRDGDGADTDPNLPPCYINAYHPLCCTPG